jgi:anti-sigma-K factor RskA
MVGPAQEHSDHSEQMAALYALELLEGEERSAFEQHLAACVECQRLVEQDGQTSSLLNAASPEREPPPELKKRLMEAAASSDLAQV